MPRSGLRFFNQAGVEIYANPTARSKLCANVNDDAAVATTKIEECPRSYLIGGPKFTQRRHQCNYFCVRDG
jgi:hypothetical protein